MRITGKNAPNTRQIEEMCDRLLAEERPFCLSCQKKTHFRKPPVEVKTRIGALRRLKGRCLACGKEVSLFLASDSGPTVHSVRVGEQVWQELQRASALLGIPQRAITENLVMDNLEEFVLHELSELERGGLIRPAERSRRERDLNKPIGQWQPPEQEEEKDPDETPNLLEWLMDLFK